MKMQEQQERKKKDERALAEKLFLSGMDDEFVSIATGKTVVACGKIRRQLGITIEPGKRRCDRRGHGKTATAIINYRRSGHSISETMKHLNVTRQQVKTACHGLNIGYAPGKKKTTEEREADAIKQIEEANAGVEYVGGYAGSGEKVKVRCKTCGSVFTISMSKFRGSTKSSKCCKICALAYVRNTLVVSTYMCSWESDEKERIKKETPKPRKEPKNKCAVCGRLTTRKKYCSVECSNKANNAAHDLKKRMFAKSKIVDKDITLQKLYLRDKGICWICGMACDYSDYRRTEKAFIAGNLYPSIDHVIPRCEGGEHSWKNIRLAHRKCNTARYSWDRRKEHTQSYIAV